MSLIVIASCMLYSNQTADLATVIVDKRKELSESKYFVIICGRSTGSLTDVGHALVIWGSEDATKKRSISSAFGFYPVSSDNSKALYQAFPGVPGEIIQEDLNEVARSKLKFITHRLIVKVDKETFERSANAVNAYKTDKYELFSNTCKSFVEKVAKDIGLNAPSQSPLEKAPKYVSRLIDANK